jgi:hypothetical protein
MISALTGCWGFGRHKAFAQRIPFLHNDSVPLRLGRVWSDKQPRIARSTVVLVWHAAVPSKKSRPVRSVVRDLPRDPFDVQACSSLKVNSAGYDKKGGSMSPRPRSSIAALSSGGNRIGGLSYSGRGGSGATGSHGYLAARRYFTSSCW